MTTEHAANTAPNMDQAKAESDPNTLAEFIDRYKDSITAKITETYTPLYRPSENGGNLPELLRSPMGKQEDAVQGAVISLKAHKGTTVVGEMGTGKTFIGTAAAHMAGFKRIVVLCPPHLVRKWKREVENTVPDVNAVIVNSITDLRKIRATNYTEPLFVIMSRERAKLSYRWKAAYTPLSVRLDPESAKFIGTATIIRPACPTCHTVPVNKEKVPLSTTQLETKKLWCDMCGDPLWQADRKGPHRYPLADYIKKYMHNYFDLFIADEVHEYKAKGSAQGIAAGIIAECCPRTLTLTGTLMGGYSSTLFHMLYRFSTGIRTEFRYGDESVWVDRYGFVERIEKHGDDEAEHGRQSRRRGYRSRIRERPGITPAALFHIIGNTVFLRLNDVANSLPPYEEVIQLSNMRKTEDHTGFSQDSAYKHVHIQLRTALAAELQKGSKKLLAAYLQTLLAYPDGCTRGETVLDPDGGDPIVAVPPLDETVAYPKEQALLDLAQEELKQGRRLLVYVTHTGTRDITPRLRELLTNKGINVQVLKADTVKPERREDWVNDRVENGMEVLICHPRLVQTGLDLVDFPSIAWYETDYSVYTMRQASRRSWRIGQHLPVKVIFMGYHQTIHMDALRLIAKKLQSSLAVEGELPDEGLSTFQNDHEDMIMALARKIANDAFEDEEDATQADVEAAFATARDAEAEAMDLLVDDEWRIPSPPDPTAEPEPTPAQPAPTRARTPEPERTPVGAGAAPPNRGDTTPNRAVSQPKLISWEELLNIPENPKPSRRKQKPEPASQNLFDWAMGVEPPK